jgi:ribosomal protein L37AE/L43A
MTLVMPATLIRCKDCGAEDHDRCDKITCDRCGNVFDGQPALMYGQARQMARSRVTVHQLAGCA